VPIQAPWGCANSALGSDAVYCVAGAYTPPTVGINTFIYPPPDACPAVGQPLFAVATATGTCLNTENNGMFYQYGCTATNATLSAFSTPDCSGAPLAPPFPFAPLGCMPSNASANQGPQVTTCAGAAAAAAADAPAADAAAAAAAAAAARAARAAAAALAALDARTAAALAAARAA